VRIFLCSSRSGYARVGPIQEELERRGHAVTPPNNYDDPGREDRMKAEGKESQLDWKAEMIVRQTEKVRANDAILVLNFKKEGQPNYLGGATFLEVFRAWELGKKIFSTMLCRRECCTTSSLPCGRRSSKETRTASSDQRYETSVERTPSRPMRPNRTLTSRGLARPRKRPPAYEKCHARSSTCTARYS
jgi:hypothetical protein